MAEGFSAVRLPWERDPLDGTGLWVYTLKVQRGIAEVVANPKPFVQWQGPYTDRLRLELTEVSAPAAVVLAFELRSQDCDTPGILVTSGTVNATIKTRGTLCIVRGWPSFGWAVSACVQGGNAEAIISLKATVDRVGGDPLVTKGILV